MHSMCPTDRANKVREGLLLFYHHKLAPHGVHIHSMLETIPLLLNVALVYIKTTFIIGCVNVHAIGN